MKIFEYYGFKYIIFLFTKLYRSGQYLKINEFGCEHSLFDDHINHKFKINQFWVDKKKNIYIFKSKKFIKLCTYLVEQ